MICWGNRNTSEFDRDGYYIGAQSGPGYDELRHPNIQADIKHQQAVVAALDRLTAAIERMKP